MTKSLRVLWWAVLAALPVMSLPAATPLQPVVECEEDVYSFQSADNGAGPLWCSGSTCLVRIGDEVFASGLETLTNAKPLNNCRWQLFVRRTNGWEIVPTQDTGRTREPAPLASFTDGSLFLSANPTLQTNRETYSGPARPEILRFAAREPRAGFQRLLPTWQGVPAFTEHSYRSFASDGVNCELILFQNIDYTHAEWTFLDKTGQWSAQGRLAWPWGAEYDHPQPIRVCYPHVILKNRAVHFVGVSDIIEPYDKWRAEKKQLTGGEWDYEFRRLFYTWTPDITTGKFRPWVEIASRDKTCGWITPGDLWLAPDGTVHLLWTEKALDERLRTKFFPDARQAHSLNYAVLRDGRVVLRRTLAGSVEGIAGEVPGRGRFQVTPEGRLFVVYYAGGQTSAGRAVAENHLLEILPSGDSTPAVRLPLQHPMTDFFTATVRGGSAPSRFLEMLGQRRASSGKLSYARVRLD